MDMTADPRSAEGFTLDHIIPLAKGGDMDGEALPAHRSCNSRRGAGRKRTAMSAREIARSNSPRTALDW